MKALDILIAARDLLSKGWTQGSAASFCSIGAVHRCSPPREGSEILNELTITMKAQSSAPCLMAWNDQPNRTQAEVLALFDQTIERIKNNDTKAIEG